MRIFKEEQRFNQVWLIALILISVLVPLGIIIGTYIKEPGSFSNVEFIVIVCTLILASSIIFFFKLSSRIDEKGIHYKFFPFHLGYKLIEWNEIDNAYVRSYSPLSEYGGWGLKGGAFRNNAKGKAVSVSGDIGIQLELKNGKKLLIGTQKQEDAKRIIATYKAKFNNEIK